MQYENLPAVLKSISSNKPEKRRRFAWTKSQHEAYDVAYGCEDGDMGPEFLNCRHINIIAPLRCFIPPIILY